MINLGRGIKKKVIMYGKIGYKLNWNLILLSFTDKEGTILACLIYSCHGAAYVIRYYICCFMVWQFD